MALFDHFGKLGPTAVLEPYEDGETGAALTTSTDAYRDTFSRLVAGERGTEERLQASIQPVEDVLRAYYYKFGRLSRDV